MIDDKQGNGTEPSLQDQLLHGFNGLDGIDEERNVQARHETTIDKLLEVSSRIIPYFAQKTQVTKFNPDYDLDYLLKGHYDELYIRLKEIELKDISFTEDDLRGFIFSNVNTDITGMDIRASQWLGIFTGCLLQLLNERNDKEGKRTSFYINGKGNKFDFLFLGAKKIHDVFVENFSGDYICSNIASHGGEADLVCGRNLKGSHLLSSIGYLDGIAKQVIGLKLEGDYAFSGCGQIRGHVHQLITVELKGNYYFSHAGAEKGHITQLVCVDINGKSDLESIGNSEREDYKGKIDWAIFDNIQPNPFSSSDVFDSYKKHYNFDTPNSPFYKPLSNEIMVKRVRALLKSDYPQIMEKVKELYALKTQNDVLYGCFKTISII